MPEQYVLQLQNISKQFPGVKALDNVSIDVKPGTVHSIVGENGAGKSTLMKIINGMLKANEGTILVDGKKVDISSPKVASELGISMIFQELNYVPNLTVAENFFINSQPKNKIGLVDWKKLKEQAADLLKQEQLDIDPEAIIATVPISDIQMLEIIKATSRQARIIIMDEPTSSLTRGETKRLFDKIVNLKQRGCTIIYISHKMDEIFELSDYVTIMRDGKTIKTAPVSEFNEKNIISMMVGREINDIYPKREQHIGDKVLELKNFSGGKFKDINMHVYAGEIVGFAGLVGAGRTEIVSALFGLDPYSEGEVILCGEPYKPKTNTRQAIEHGLVMATEDRRKFGLVATRSIKENISLPFLRSFSRLTFLNRKKEVDDVTRLFTRLAIKAPSINTLTSTLSGGNQQKVILAKWLLETPKVLIMDEPTRGIDVGAKHEIYQIMNELADAGVAIIMISSEMPELIGMCKRLYVIADGRITGELNGSEITQEAIMTYATGGQ